MRSVQKQILNFMELTATSTVQCAILRLFLPLRASEVPVGIFSMSSALKNDLKSSG